MPATETRSTRPRGPEALRHVEFLCSQSEHHHSYTISDIERCILPPLELRQNRFLCRKGMVTGFASWAFLKRNTAQRFIDGTRKLAPQDWALGSELWLIDVIAPFGDTAWFCRRLRKHWAKTYPEFPVVNYVRSHDRHTRRTVAERSGDR